MKHDYNCLNPKYILHLLEFIIRIFEEQGDNLTDVHITKWGVSDDFIFSEYFYDYCEELLPCERKALMHITRAIVDSSAEAYHELITDGYYGYEDLSNIDLLDELYEKTRKYGVNKGLIDNT
tara:strand:+ start:6310 stop:6675 length:366 start_codon:yes stop_codon:yes gene_type:complete